MKRRIAVATFVLVASTAIGASAIALEGSDTLYGYDSDSVMSILTGFYPTPIDFRVAVDCGGQYQGNTAQSGSGAIDPASGHGDGSSAAEIALAHGTQVVAPMARALSGSMVGRRTDEEWSATGVCVASAALLAGAESIPFALGSVVVVGNIANFSSGNNICNGDAQDCSRATNPIAGIAYTNMKVISAPGYVCPVGGIDSGCTNGTYRIHDFKDALRLLYAGFDHDAGADRSKRDCDSAPRAALANNWSNMLESSCSTGACTRIQHAFRPADSTDAGEVFTSLLNLPAARLEFTAAEPSRSAFCNAVDANDVLTGALPAAPIPLGDPANATPPNTPAGVYFPTSKIATPSAARAPVASVTASSKCVRRAVTWVWFFQSGMHRPTRRR